MLHYQHFIPGTKRSLNNRRTQHKLSKKMKPTDYRNIMYWYIKLKSHWFPRLWGEESRTYDRICKGIDAWCECSLTNTHKHLATTAPSGQVKQWYATFSLCTLLLLYCRFSTSGQCTLVFFFFKKMTRVWWFWKE